MVEVRYQTLGEAFIEDLELARKSKSSLFDFLLRTIKKDSPSEEIYRVVNNITDSESLINYYDVLARLQVERNSKTINSIRNRLEGIRPLKGSDAEYMKIMRKKLNILSAMTIGLKEHLYMIVNCYIRGEHYGSILDFKEEFLEYAYCSKHGSGCTVRTPSRSQITAAAAL